MCSDFFLICIFYCSCLSFICVCRLPVIIFYIIWLLNVCILCFAYVSINLSWGFLGTFYFCELLDKSVNTSPPASDETFKKLIRVFFLHVHFVLFSEIWYKQSLKVILWNKRFQTKCFHSWRGVKFNGCKFHLTRYLNCLDLPQNTSFGKCIGNIFSSDRFFTGLYQTILQVVYVASASLFSCKVVFTGFEVMEIRYAIVRYSFAVVPL